MIFRIYKPKYMDESTSKTPDSKEKKRPDTAVSNKDAKKDDKTGGRARSRSIWGRSKKDKPAIPDTATMPSAA